jgi:hypothetical protein
MNLARSRSRDLGRRPAKNLVSLQILEEIRMKILAVFGNERGLSLRGGATERNLNDAKTLVGGYWEAAASPVSSWCSVV